MKHPNFLFYTQLHKLCKHIMTTQSNLNEQEQRQHEVKATVSTWLCHCVTLYHVRGSTAAFEYSSG